MSESLPRYRRLPGRRRGLLKGASLWIAEDHLLAVRSVRFREEYKRYYLRDVQAIVIADMPRFHLSTRAILAAILLVVSYAFLRVRWEGATVAFWLAAGLAAGAWVYISAARSCACRIYTAVSRDELPSLYRRWTARRFLAELEPRIGQAQGVLDGNWAEALEFRAIGPPGAASEAPFPRVRAGARSRTLASDLFVAALFLDAFVNLLALSYDFAVLLWFGQVLIPLEIAAGVAILVQYHRRRIGSGMRKLALVALLAIGGLYYVRIVLAGMGSGAQSATAYDVSLPVSRTFDEIDLGVALVLGMAGVAISVSGPGISPPGPGAGE